MATSLSQTEQAEVRRQVSSMFQGSRAYQAMPAGERARILANTAAIVDALAGSDRRRAQGMESTAKSDPYSFPRVNPLQVTPGPNGSGASSSPSLRQTKSKTSQSDFGAGLDKGVAAAGSLLREVDFPGFVSSLVQGVFKAVVSSSIEQMKAYGELVQSVAMSLNEFRDQNVSANQGRDHLVSRYPNLFQVNIVDGQPQVGARPNADQAELPNFQQDFGLSEPISDLDDETIEQTLVPAARDDLARSRQKLLATMVLMGINRIIVTDGKINAKLKFNFSAQDTMQQTRTAVGYENFGTTTTEQKQYEKEGTTGERSSTFADGKWESKTGAGNYFASGAYQATSAPVIKVTDQTDTQTQANLNAAAQLSGEVSLNFKSETFPLEKMLDSNQMTRLQSAQSAGRAAPTATANPVAPAPTTAPPAATSPAV